MLSWLVLGAWLGRLLSCGQGASYSHSRCCAGAVDCSTRLHPTLEKEPGKVLMALETAGKSPAQSTGADWLTPLSAVKF